MTDGTVSEKLGTVIQVRRAVQRRIQLTAFTQAIDERVGSLNRRETVDGEEVMARLIADFDEPKEARSTR